MSVNGKTHTDSFNIFNDQIRFTTICPIIHQDFGVCANILQEVLFVHFVERFQEFLVFKQH